MLFNSIEFAIFLPIVFALYWFVFNRSLKLQNFVILAASYVFYGWWDWRFLALILASTLLDYSVGNAMVKTENHKKRKQLLAISLFFNLGSLGFFKYYNFFVESFVDAFSFFGQSLESSTLHIILPVGISFYTFQTLSYTIDIYRRKLEPTKDFIAFAAFVSFFPQLVAGPIERATNLLPQFFKNRSFSYPKAVDGMRQILWGLFKKVVVADTCGELVDIIFDNSGEMSSSSLILGGLLFAFQIYGDFSGYSDIAIGTSRLFGFNLMQNFNFPYFSRDIAEFWRRWHISLSTWFRDYLYIPLGGSRGNTWMRVRNTFIIFIVSGFWHGANWTFIIWGALNAIYFLPLLLVNRNRKNLDGIAEGRVLPTLREGTSILFTFAFTVLAWVFFRAESVGHALSYLSRIFTQSPMANLNNELKLPDVATSLAGIAVLIIIEWVSRNQQHALQTFGIKWPRVFRYAFYYTLVIAVFWYSGREQEFIYFQF